MCLIPTKVIKEIGLSLPMFIKWDDAEFGLRARDAGYPTVTLPGVAVWHVPWHEKDDTIDWQAYFHRRNRIIAALLHSPYERGGRLILESFETQVKHLLSMQYGPAEMGLMAIEDILEGPQRMHRDVLKRLPELFELRKGYDDSRSQTDLDLFPTRGPAQAAAPRQGADARRRPGWPGPRRWSPAPSGRCCRSSAMARERPEANVPHIDLKWWLLAQFDSALVSSADGTRGGLVQARPGAVPRPARPLGRAAHPAGQGVAAPGRAVQGGAAGAGVAGHLEVDVRRVAQGGRAGQPDGCRPPTQRRINAQADG